MPAEVQLGVDFDGENQLDQTTTFQYGFVAAPTFICHCTNDPKALTCGRTCDQWHSGKLRQLHLRLVLSEKPELSARFY